MTGWEAQQLLAHTDLFLGMHGAGLTNSMWGKPGAVVLQLLPYGWKRPNGTIVRGHGFGNIAQVAGMHYLTWINTRPEYAFLRLEDFPPHNTDVPWPYQEHPSPDWPMPIAEPVAGMWVYQSTIVDMADFTPVLEQAFELAGIPKRSLGQHQAPAGSIVL